LSLHDIDRSLSDRHFAETRAGERFGFGENWRTFLKTVDESRIQIAVDSLKEALDVETLAGKRFVDVGSGSGLFSLAAHRLGAAVTSFDYDPASVGCTREICRRYGSKGAEWRILHGSVLDRHFLAGLGTFDIVYSWGVLHHTGSMWQAIENILPMVQPGGLLFISIYNDQGVWSKRWRSIKRFYCSGTLGRVLIPACYIPYRLFRFALSDVVRLRPPWHSIANYRRARGMSVWHDCLDWLGGYPFEFAKPEEIILPLQKQGLTLRNLNTQYGTVGCVEYVFARTPTVDIARESQTTASPSPP
jgi:2-polyprenyl-6-hydroxyphenyl methylase/3-demethylubiquinone-9 3-methyltransferase